jgi:hypothetical protein
VATRASDFVDEWWSRSWDQAAGWSLTSGIENLRNWHDEKLSKDSLGRYQERHCRNGDLDVAFEADDPSSGAKTHETPHFLVRQAAALEFTMLNVDTKPPASCGGVQE